MFLKNLENFEIPEHVIIGAGPAGITLAIELEKKGIKSLIIEAGDKFMTEKSQNLYKGNFFGENYFELHEARLRCLGGSSGHWGGNCMPLDISDIENWPINYNDLYLNNLQIHRILNLEIEQKFQEDQNILNGYKLINFKQSDVNFGIKFEEVLTNNKKIFIILNSPLIEIKNDIKNKNKVSQIQLLINNKKKNIKIKNLILACGGIENSRILLWSREKNNIGVLKNLPIGSYWSDHPGGPVGQLLTSENKYKKNFDKKIFQPNLEYIKKNKLNNFRLRFVKVSQPKNSIKRSIKKLLCFYPNLGKKILENFETNKSLYCNYYISFSAEQKPKKSNRIFLSSKKDELGIPVVSIQWDIGDDVYNTIKFALDDIGFQLINNNLGRIGMDLNLINKVFKNNKEIIYANYHHMGGTIMGEDSKTSVVDPNLKVHGMENLYIAGSSVFPSTGHANPTYTIVALSIRLAEYLSEL